MTKSDLIKALSEEMEISEVAAEEAVNTIFSSISSALIQGDRVEIRGLGSFRVKDYEGYMGRNPATGEKIKVKPKKLPFFKCGKELRERADYHPEND
jgi:integration host factor subunit beta